MHINIDKDSICWSTLDSETLILNLDSGYYYTLDSFSGLVWGMLVDGCDEDGIISYLAAEYSLEKLDVIRDLKSFTSELAIEGIVTMDISDLSQTSSHVDKFNELTVKMAYSRPHLVKHERLYELGIGS